MRYYRGDLLAKMTFGKMDSIVHYEEEQVKAISFDDWTIERVKVNSGTFPINGPINPLTLTQQLPAGSAEVTLYKLIRRPWYNHIKALLF